MSGDRIILSAAVRGLKSPCMVPGRCENACNTRLAPFQMIPSDFSAALVRWQQRSGRHDLPWQQYTTPYERLVSEVMLQQTQVETVIPYYRRFIERFPTVEALSAAPDDELMRLWAGLGYYARARNLRRAAQKVVGDFGGVFPVTAEGLETLPGVGPSTAAAVAAFTVSEAVRPMVDGNVKRVLARVLAVPGRVGERPFEKAVHAGAVAFLPGPEDIAAYTQGLMDLGSLVCRRRSPACGACPVRSFCRAAALGRPEDCSYPKKPPVKRERHLIAGFVVTRRGLWLRPGTDSIWRGLWCPEISEIPVGTTATLPSPPSLGLSGDWDTVFLGELQRELTHQRLRIEAWACLRSEGRPADPAFRSFGADPEAWPGMPAPIRLLALRAVRAAGHSV